jgi:hypothetical protein
MKRALLVVAVLVGSASAAPKSKAARKHFDKGVTAYTKGDFAAAAAAFSKSNAIEQDMETMFAWAQSERQLDHCDKAIELYDKLLATDMPSENKEAVKVQIGECKEILAKQKPANTTKPDTTKPDTTKPDTTKPDTTKPDTTKPDTTPLPDTTAHETTANANGANDTTPSTLTGPSPETPATPEGRAWWKDPVGGALVGAGVVGMGLGTVFLVQGSSANSDKDTATTYDEYQAFDDRAKSRGQLGVITLVAGGALAAGGVVWYVTHKPSHNATVTGWLDGQSGGLVVHGGF